MVPFSFRNEEMVLLDAGANTAAGTGASTGARASALYWPRERALLVADLHLEKASFFARTGQMLPPYDSRETLERLALAVRRTGARRVFALGDNFHDSAGPDRLEPHAAGMLAALTRALDWVWITGNHDPHLGAEAGGTRMEELVTGGIALRHQALPGTAEGEVSGHFHPRLVVQARGRRIARPCAVNSGNRLILPAFGALTGGMDAADPAILSALQPADAIEALVPAQGRLVRFPLWRKAA
ncbi:ligase-associated DNA damage response endonuclease PdeM [Novosphingobium sp. FGD1]|jgi:DNA ligase-associated metallophosphoesterase|uniref:Ligase-associated DNA damage response endonuclease PdeM n=1 Tax=Novosphingobium silvae TaxID=2692619 RepID=A0A7X4K831_9SPHN|nr:ligase-associated DNA damage response endonuclease PdeM [Novosphingobium silvae]MYL98632.1 ligase-associated DNA damage response endonuclease PdeM [Novosphingobium silvae]